MEADVAGVAAGLPRFGDLPPPVSLFDVAARASERSNAADDVRAPLLTGQSVPDSQNTSQAAAVLAQWTDAQPLATAKSGGAPAVVPPPAGLAPVTIVKGAAVDMTGSPTEEALSTHIVRGRGSIRGNRGTSGVTSPQAAIRTAAPPPKRQRLHLPVRRPAGQGAAILLAKATSRLRLGDADVAAAPAAALERAVSAAEGAAVAAAALAAALRAQMASG